MKSIFAAFREWRRARAWAKLTPREKKLLQWLGAFDAQGRPVPRERYLG